ncbi:MAG: hypothetical protein ABIH23_01275, partial [bacterium]
TISGITVPLSSTVVHHNDTYFEIETQTVARAEQLTDYKIGGVNLNFNWKYSFDSGYTWEDAGTSSNFCYVTFAKPIAPWSTDGYTGIPVYVEMMDYACCAMSGATDEFNALQKLTLGTAGFMIYDGTKHYTGNSYVSYFYVREFVKDCNEYTSGPAEGNDCRDFSCAADSLAAAMGVDSLITAFARNTWPTAPHDFATKPIKYAGGTWVWSATFEYHQVNYLPESSFPLWDISDGSLLLDSVPGGWWTNPGILADYDITYADYVTQLVESGFDIGEFLDQNYCTLSEGVRPWYP